MHQRSLLLRELSKLFIERERNLTYVPPLGQENVDTVVVDLIGALLSGVRDPATRLLVSECLGEIGALDLGLLETKLTTTPSKHKVVISFNWP